MTGGDCICHFYFACVIHCPCVIKNAENLKDFLLKSAEILKETRFIYAQNLNAYHSSSLPHPLFLYHMLFREIILKKTCFSP
ncbi:hypothetical protein SAMN04487901_10743 [Prevotella communis]|uniref:Uncharacterized protein n=1 Tax=Prevotella communis TaxID=2913614 RepID=A0A1G7W5M0_9BACT|nr:hypothetical protein SAMN04487901_10743 [Prevotella communis]